MRLDPRQAQARFAAAKVARLATVTAAGLPHIVPIVFAVDDDTVYTAVDAKPKSTTALRRLANIAVNPNIAVLADYYDEDWAQLWWVRADGTGQIAEGTRARIGMELLIERYPVYRDRPPPGPVLVFDITRWSGWSAGRA